MVRNERISNENKGDVMEPIKASDRLPEDRKYVLVHLVKGNWGDSDDEIGGRYWKVAKFVRGISEREREDMESGRLRDTEIEVFSGFEGNHTCKRSSLYRGEDEHGNNLVPYKWEPFGPGSYFGQEVDYWCELPSIDS